MLIGSFIARKLTNQERKSKLEKQKKRQRETILFMKGVMDEVTHLANYSTPVDPELVTFVVAKEDAYYPQSPHLPPMNEVWPSCDVSNNNTYWINCDVLICVFSRLLNLSKSHQTIIGSKLTVR